MPFSNAKMNAWDAVSGSLAECIMTIDKKKYNFMQLIDFEASIEKIKIDIPILGKTGKGHKTTAWNGTFKGKAHYNQSLLRKLLATYKDGFTDTYFEIQVTNTDGDNTQVIILKDCNMDGGILTKLDVNADFLEEEMEGTFDDFEIKTEFTELTGMKVTEN